MTFQFGLQVAFWTQMEGLLFSPNDLKFCGVLPSVSQEFRAFNT
jgi:hypothetical protein